MPKRKPKFLQVQQEDGKPVPAAKKLVPFSSHDSGACEVAYQQLADRYTGPETSQFKESPIKDIGDLESSEDTIQVPVHEDYRKCLSVHSYV